MRDEIICISSRGKTLSDGVAEHFNVCPYFLLVNPVKDEIKAVPNPGAKDNPTENGLPAARTVLREKIDVVITGDIGPKAFGALESYDVRICIGVMDKSCQAALNDYLLGKLKPII